MIESDPQKFAAEIPIKSALLEVLFLASVIEKNNAAIKAAWEELNRLDQWLESFDAFGADFGICKIEYRAEDISINPAPSPVFSFAT